jgi:hypothetical protein
MKINSDTLKRRAFILSSLRRLNIPISTFAYKFADKIISEGWMPTLACLDEVDTSIKNKYEDFINGQN